jgi:CRISPR-associated endonuclease/helicase Cas3
MKPQFYAHTPSKLNPNRWHDLKEHLKDVANITSQLATKLSASELGYYAGLWHDLGKYNPAFQKYLEHCHQGSDQARSIPHAIYGAILASERLSPLAPIIDGHHAGLPQIQNMMQKRVNHPNYAADYETVLKLAGEAGIDLKPTLDLKATLPDFQDKLQYELFLRLLFSCLVDADFLDTEAHFSPELTQHRAPIYTVQDLRNRLEIKQAQLLTNADPNIVNQVRAEVYHACLDAATVSSGVFRLAVPTGGGKTRSSLTFALNHAVQHGHDRVIVAVPYTSIIEQTVEVYRSLFGEAAVLEHHSAAKAIVDDEDARTGAAQARLATQNWDAPLIVTTTVQLLESLFHNRTRRCRKLHNIVNSVIILDEVQTLPIRLLEPVVNVLQELTSRYHVTVVLCTATQPALEGNSPYLKGFNSVRDIIPSDQAIEHFRVLSRVNYEAPEQPWSWEHVVQDIQEHHHSQALIVLNTRKDALELLSQFQSCDGVFHLSTLLCGAHRREVLAQVRSRLQNDLPCYLVSTQVVEAGVDLDFPVVYRALGPLDRIVQAAGRCNREGKRATKGRVVIFHTEQGRTPPGEYATAIQQTANLLKQQPNFDDPEIFQPYFRSLYQGINTDQAEIQKYRAAYDYPETARRFKLIPDETYPVVIEYDDRAREVLREIQNRGLRSRDHRALQPYLVNLRQREFQQSTDVRREIAPGIWVWEGGYDPVQGILIGNTAIVRDPADLIF